MGWIVPFFVCNGINVISYDQRGTGESSGNWRASGPRDRARDVDAIYDAFRGDVHVNPQRIGVWGFSNGGWTAPIVAVNRPIAFMILKSPPTESIERNALFEQQEAMIHAGRDQADIAQATAAEKAVIDAILGNAPISAGRNAYAKARRAEWYKDSLFAMVAEKDMLTEPYLSGWRHYLSYDPAGVLARVRTPTLALYGVRDRKVDVHHDAPLLIAAYAKSGTRLTVKWFSDAGHTLKVTPNGFELANPERYSRGFPDVMLQWLREQLRAAGRPRRSAGQTRNMPNAPPVPREDCQRKVRRMLLKIAMAALYAAVALPLAASADAVPDAAQKTIIASIINSTARPPRDPTDANSQRGVCHARARFRARRFQGQADAARRVHRAGQTGDQTTARHVVRQHDRAPPRLSDPDDDRRRRYFQNRRSDSSARRQSRDRRDSQFVRTRGSSRTGPGCRRRART